MTTPTGLEVVTNQTAKESILASPEISRRLISNPVNVNDPANHFLREADGPAVIGKQGLHDYVLTAPTVEAANPHVNRLIDWVFYQTDGLALWFESENGFGAELGADPAGFPSKLTRDGGRIAPIMFSRWRLLVERRIERHEPIRVEGGRLRRALTKAGAALANVRDRDKEDLDRRLGFLALSAAGGQTAKGIITYNDFAVLRGFGAIREVGSRPSIEFELCGVRVKVIDGKFEMAAGRA